ncbi:putative protein aurora borealis isoform X2 [Ditylenchus destructor]|uniref:Protein aurora borealis n=1 Tax=Ditylenchus destructor TaxID=166010 RepID=A0AAD4NEE5_9BILA|nr:putative protein aurora borealis isoform X2 [Ditylenchus destructor]
MTNPFNASLLENLTNNTLTPGIFKRVPRDCSPHSESTWSIEHLAALKPANIDEQLLEKQSEEHDPAFEAQANAAIEKFWSQNIHLPSPDVASIISEISPQVNSTPISTHSYRARYRRFQTPKAKPSPSNDKLDDNSPCDKEAKVMKSSSIVDDPFDEIDFSEPILAEFPNFGGTVLDPDNDFSVFTEALQERERAVSLDGSNPFLDLSLGTTIINAKENETKEQ